jgi:hypothetical protein
MYASTRSPSAVGRPEQALITPLISSWSRIAAIWPASSSMEMKSYWFLPVVKGKEVRPSSAAARILENTELPKRSSPTM